MYILRCVARCPSAYKMLTIVLHPAQMPAFLLSLLCYAFWLSFARVGADNVAPTTWPLLWLAFAALVMFNPMPTMFKPSRWWLIKNVGKLLTSGMHRVEVSRQLH